MRSPRHAIRGIANMISVAALIFPNVQTLDLFGPLELLGWLPEKFKITTVGETAGTVRCRSGQLITVDRTLSDGSDYDIILVPGGPGTPVEKQNYAINEWLVSASESARAVMSVCTGSALLASIGLLDGRRATTNKMDFEWAVSYGPRVDWVGRARWVEDGKFFTSSGVSAGMDMCLALIARLFDRDLALWVAKNAEYSWHEDASWDPFAVEYGTL